MTLNKKTFKLHLCMKKTTIINSTYFIPCSWLLLFLSEQDPLVIVTIFCNIENSKEYT